MRMLWPRLGRALGGRLRISRAAGRLRPVLGLDANGGDRPADPEGEPEDEEYERSHGERERPVALVEQADQEEQTDDGDAHTDQAALRTGRIVHSAPRRRDARTKVVRPGRRGEGSIPGKPGGFRVAVFRRPSPP